MSAALGILLFDMARLALFMQLTLELYCISLSVKEMLPKEPGIAMGRDRGESGGVGRRDVESLALKMLSAKGNNALCMDVRWVL